MARTLFKIRRTEVKPLLYRETDEDRAVPTQTVERDGQNAVHGDSVPKEYGGQGCDPL